MNCYGEFNGEFNENLSLLQKDFLKINIEAKIFKKQKKQKNRI